MLGNAIFGVNRKAGSPKSPKIHPSFKDEGFSEGPLVVSYNAFGALFEDNPNSMWICDARKMRFLAVNHAAIQNYMYSREEFAAMTMDQIHPQEELQAFKEYWEDPQKPCARRIWRNRRKDGTVLEAEITACPLMFHGHKAQLIVASDVTGRERARAELRDAQERYRDLFEHSNDILFTTDLQGKITSLNKAGESVTGYRLDEVIETDAAQILGPKTLELKRSLREKRVLEGGETSFELDIARKDGRLITLAVRISLIYRDRKPVGIRGIGRDITEDKHLEERLRQSQKMEALGRLASGISHDFNNLLGVIIGYAELLRDATKCGENLRRFADETLKAGNRAAALTGQLLAFSRSQVLQLKVLDLNASIANMEQLVRRLIREDIELTFEPGPTAGRVKADPGQVEQVIMNLAVNARDAMPHGGELRISTGTVDLDESYRHREPYVPPGRYVVLTVSDTGVGMDAKTKASIFEPFFTTKQYGKGTGLGLATVYGIVKQSDGAIAIESQPGKGTKFTIFLPLVEAPLTHPATEAEPIDVLTGTETILLVDDNEAFRGLVRTLLEKSGYTILEARASSEAAKIATTYAGSIDLLLTDIVMPQVDGYQLSDYLRFHREKMRVLCMSGYAGSTCSMRSGSKPRTRVLPKPFCKEALFLAVRQVLDEPRPPEPVVGSATSDVILALTSCDGGAQAKEGEVAVDSWR
jgi:two-component system cell cycle sensor histidine kinase/response regulator CckA